MINIKKSYEVYFGLDKSVEEETRIVKECIEVSGEKIIGYTVERNEIQVRVMSNTMDNRLGKLYPSAKLTTIYIDEYLR